MSTTGSRPTSLQVLEATASLEGAPVAERRRWSESFKAELVEKALEPHVNVSAIARRAGVHPAQLFAWKRQAVSDASAPFDLGLTSAPGDGVRQQSARDLRLPPRPRARVRRDDHSARD